MLGDGVRGLVTSHYEIKFAPLVGPVTFSRRHPSRMEKRHFLCSTGSALGCNPVPTVLWAWACPPGGGVGGRFLAVWCLDGRL